MPTVTCPGDVTVKLLHRVSNFSASADDNTGIRSIVSSPAQFTPNQRIFENTTVEFIVNDYAGNSANCSVDITVKGKEVSKVCI